MQQLYEHYWSAISAHKDVCSKTLEDLIDKIDQQSTFGVAGNVLFCVLDVKNLSYPYIGKNCETFFGLPQETFLEKGTKVLSELAHPVDFQALITELIPAMNEINLAQDVPDILNTTFELHYRMKNVKTGLFNYVVEMSSYMELDDNKQPLLSSGMIIQHPSPFTCVRGILRRRKEHEHQVLLDKKWSPFNKILSTREREIAGMLCEGMSKKEIAERLYLAEGTVHSHKKNIYKRLQINKLADLLALKEQLFI